MSAAIEIGDPSSIQYGAAALQQIKLTEEIVFDLFAIANQRKEDSEILRHIAWLFYWLGFSENGVWTARNILLSLDGGWEKLYKENTRPETNLQETEKMADEAGKFMKMHYTAK